MGNFSRWMQREKVVNRPTDRPPGRGEPAKVLSTVGYSDRDANEFADKTECLQSSRHRPDAVRSHKVGVFWL
jgi:hypothetical protein